MGSRTTKQLRCAGLLLLLACGGAMAQLVLSSQAGLIHYVEGEAFLDGVRRKSLSLQMKEGESLRTAEGLAEVLLARGEIVRIGKASELRMTGTGLEQAEFAVEGGSAMLEVAGILKGNVVRMRFGESVTEVRRDGLYRIDAVAGELRVYGGEAEVRRGAEEIVKVKRGRSLALGDQAAQPMPFDRKAQDALHLWSGERSFRLMRSNPRSGSRWTNDSPGWVSNKDYGIARQVRRRR